ncbi:hypothetical protein [Erythrobacter tepidarius]|uniref:hypothetical protein n=1 Tax=Erythrobacter tepidarius TaxID=60454 RepID=UPI000A3AE733|nr:hypothetical protein [Erythrobacter tepidarius]
MAGSRIAGWACIRTNSRCCGGGRSSRASAWTAARCLAEVGRITFERETTGLAVLVARRRARLEPFGLARMVAPHPDGAYYLATALDPADYRLTRSMGA